MFHRVLSILVLLVSLAAPAQSPVSRPPGAGAGKLFGEVGFVQGTAYLRSAITFAAQPGMPVLEGDEISVGTGSYLLLVLRNGQVARLDEEITLRTSEIMSAQASKRNDLETQLERLVGKTERKKVRDRIAGSYARVTAATDAPVESAATRPMKPPLAPAPLSRSGATRGPGLDMPAPGGGGARAMPVESAKRESAVGALKSMVVETEASSEERAAEAAPAPAPPPPPSAPPPAQAASRSADSGGAPAAAFATWSLRDATGLHPKSGPPPRLLAKLQADKAFRACLEEALEPLPSPPGSIEVLLRVKGGQIRRVVLGGALTPPACLAKYARGKLPGVKAGWVSFTVSVP